MHQRHLLRRLRLGLASHEHGFDMSAKMILLFRHKPETILSRTELLCSLLLLHNGWTVKEIAPEKTIPYLILFKVRHAAARSPAAAKTPSKPGCFCAAGVASVPA